MYMQADSPSSNGQPKLTITVSNLLLPHPALSQDHVLLLQRVIGDQCWSLDTAESDLGSGVSRSKHISAVREHDGVALCL